MESKEFPFFPPKHHNLPSMKPKRSPKHCPICEARGDCIDSRHVNDKIIRRYDCAKCGRWNTHEILVGQCTPRVVRAMVAHHKTGWLDRLNKKLDL